MDLRQYYQRIRDIEETIAGEHVVVMSEKTPDGGHAGVLTEVSRAMAAKLITDLRARLATDEEAQGFRDSMAEAARSAVLRNTLPFTLSDEDVRTLLDTLKPGKPKGK